MSCITINTDASWCPYTDAAGYAFWIVNDFFLIKEAGELKGTTKNSTDAEMKSIGNAIFTLLSKQDLRRVNHLIVNTDSMLSIRKILNPDCPISTYVNKLWKMLIARLGSTNNKFKHVKAHSGKDDARSKVNEWCDTQAKIFMKKKRKKINNYKNQNR